MDKADIKEGDRVRLMFPTPRAPALGRVGVVAQLDKHNGLAVVCWDTPDYLGFTVSTRTLDVLRKVTS